MPSMKVFSKKKMTEIPKRLYMSYPEGRFIRHGGMISPQPAGATALSACARSYRFAAACARQPRPAATCRGPPRTTEPYEDQGGEGLFDFLNRFPDDQAVGEYDLSVPIPGLLQPLHEKIEAFPSHLIQRLMNGGERRFQPFRELLEGEVVFFSEQAKKQQQSAARTKNGFFIVIPDLLL